MRYPALNNLHLTLVLTIVLPLLLISGIGVYWGLGVIQSQDEAQLKEDLALMAQATKYPLSRALQARDYVQVNDITTSLFSAERVYGASVYDRRGDRISQVGVVDRDISGSRSAADAVAKGDELGTYREIGGKNVFSHFTPLFSEDGRIIGLLQITRKRSDFEQRLSDLRANAWWIWAVMGGAIVLVAIVGHYSGVGRHVARLLETMNRVRAGDRRVRARLAGPREMRQIALALNGMLESIEEAERAMHAQKAREARLNQRLQHQEKVAMIGRVAGGVAHELGAPLSVIDGRARMLERRVVGEGSYRNLAEIRQQVDRMTRIIRQLLDCFRHSPWVEEGRVKTRDLVAASLEALAEEKARSGVEVAVDNPVPDTAIKGDQTRLELAVTNLLRNALQAASERVLLSVRAGSQAVALTVEDDGPGISAVDRDSVFEPFYTTKPAGEGTGLGLAMVRSIMQEHNGAIIIGTSRWGGCAIVLQWQPSGSDDAKEAAEASHD